MEKSEIEALLDAKVAAMRESMIPHNCFTCKWFTLRTEKPRNRVCRFPSELKCRGNLCLSWELQKDPALRNKGFC